MRTRATLTVVAILAGVVAFAASPARACATGTTPIVYVGQVGCDTSLWVMQPDGSSTQQITDIASDTNYPRWSPDGTRIAFSRWTDNVAGDDIWIYTVATATLTRLPATNDNDVSPSWSPDGTRIVFTSWAASSNLWTIGVDGTGLTQLTNLGVPTNSAAWSPDGTRIVFVAVTGGRPDLYSIHPDGTGLVQLTSASNVDYGAMQPAWSPDGARIVFVQDDGGASHLMLMDPNGTNVTHLTQNGCEYDYMPSFTIDGTHVLYARAANAPTGIYVVPVDGSTPPQPIVPTDQQFARYAPAQAPPTTTTTSTTVVAQAAPRFTC